MDAGSAQRLLQRAVIREQAGWLRRGASDQIGQIFDDGLVGVGHRRAVRRAACKAGVAHPFERLFGRRGHQADAFDVNHLERAVRLVQMGLCMLQRGAAGVRVVH